MYSRVRTLSQKQISGIFPVLFQDSDWVFKGSKIHINPYTPKNLMLILLTASPILHILAEFDRLTDFQNFPGPVAFFQDYDIIKFQNFQGFPCIVRTLYVVLI